jgi:HAD superfamily hydrolase (TIGR01509 family)
MGVTAIFPDPVARWTWDQAMYRRLLKTTGGKERIAGYVRADLGLDPGPHAELIARVHAAKTARYADLMAAGAITLRPGVEEVLNKARATGLALAVATTTSPGNVDALIQATLRRRADEVFDVIAAGDDVAAKKPAPDVYLLALSRLGLPADAALAIEDSRNGLLSAKSAGLRCVVSPGAYTDDEDFADADHLVDRLDWDDLARVAAAW